MRMPAVHLDAQPSAPATQQERESRTQFVHPRTAYHGRCPQVHEPRVLRVMPLATHGLQTGVNPVRWRLRASALAYSAAWL